MKFSTYESTVKVPKDQPVIPIHASIAPSHPQHVASDLSSKEIELLLASGHERERGREGEVRFQTHSGVVTVPKDQPVDGMLLQEAKIIVSSPNIEWRSRSRSKSREGMKRVGSDLSHKEWELLDSKMDELAALATSPPSPASLLSDPSSSSSSETESQQDVVAKEPEARPKNVHHVSFSHDAHDLQHEVERPRRPIQSSHSHSPGKVRLGQKG